VHFQVPSVHVVGKRGQISEFEAEGERSSGMTFVNDGDRRSLISCLLIPEEFMSSRGKLMAALALMALISTICYGQGTARNGGIDPTLMARATAGNPDAEFRVGVQYEVGANVAKDPAQAAAWYRKAADKGFAQAEHSLGVLYEFGNGVPADYTLAAQWYRKAAEQGFAPAQFSLGLCYVHGRGVPQDYGKALEWYGKAAQQKNSDALLNLAFLYHNGLGVPKDEARSFDLVRQAAEAGSPDAQFQLGMDYQDGEQGLQPDNEQARKWLHRSAAQGDVAAQFNYAMLLKAQPALVYFWLSVAEPHLTGDTKQKTTTLRSEAATRLPPAEKAEIDQRVKAWRPVEEQP
jgi:TPR repeat protein